jgi:hypothetical protein
MEPEEPYIPFKERTPKELCRDIILKAEDSYLNKEKKALLTGIVIFLAFLAVNWYSRWITDTSWWVGLGIVGAVYFVFYFVNRKMINEMNLTANPKQFLDIAQRLKKCLRVRNFISISTAAWLSIVQMFDLWDSNIWWWSVVSIIPALFLGWIGISINPVSKSDSAFCEEIEELEFRLSE